MHVFSEWLALALSSLPAIAGLSASPALSDATTNVAMTEPWPLREAGMVYAQDEATSQTASQPRAVQGDEEAVEGVNGAGAKAAVDDGSRAILERLERDGANITAFTAEVTYEVTDAMIEERVMRKGDMIYVKPKGADAAELPNPGGAGGAGGAVSIKLISRIDFGADGLGRKRDEVQEYLFNDRWLVEVLPAQKLFIKRELVPPGEKLDPFKLGEGPFPLPIGQKADDVLARFDVTVIELPEEGLLSKLRDGVMEIDGLRLVPKPNTPAVKDIDHIDLFFDSATALPIGIIVVEKGANRIKTVRLDQAIRNPDLDLDQRRRLTIEVPDPTEWRIDIRPL